MYTVTGGDWDDLLADSEFGGHDERIIVNMGPQHPSTHGVLRLILELEGETVVQARSVIGYLHTGIEKSCEYRTWTQGVTFVTRADYLSPAFNEAAYCMAVEKLLGIQVPERADVIRVLLMELTRISSHLVAIATGGMELGALTGMTAGFREREEALHLMEYLTGLRMNMAFIRPGGVAQDLPEGSRDKITEFIAHGAAASGVRQAAHRPADLEGPDGRRRHPAPGGLHAAGHHRPDPALAPGCPGTCARRCRTAGTRPTTSRCPPSPRPTATPGSSPAARDVGIAEDHEAVQRPAGPARQGHGRRCRRSPGRPSCPSAQTEWATRWSTSARSWASRWSR